MQLTAGALSLARETFAELAPCGITDAFGEAMVLHHALNIEFFNGDNAETVDDAPSVLMAEIMAAVPDAFMDTTKNLVGFSTRRTSLRSG